MQEEKTFNLNVHVHRLLQAEPFFAALSRRIDKRPSCAIPTAGVRVNQDTQSFEMLYNPSFFEKLSDPERADVLKHEFYHLVFEHVTGRRPNGVNHLLWNYATDLAINSHLENLPKGCLKPGQDSFADWPAELSAEAYLERLKKDEEDKECTPVNGLDEESEEGDEGAGGGSSGQDDSDDGPGDGLPGQFDSHEGWSEGDSTTREIAKERLKNFMKKAVKEAAQKGWGSVPGECQKEIIERLVSKVDWRKVLRYFVKTSQKANKSSSIKRINRRYPYIHPGRKTLRTAKIAISIDQSGSVDDGMLVSFFTELNKLAEIAEFTVIPFDCTVAENDIYVWKKGENRKSRRVRYGGTCFDAPTKYVNDRAFDGHIILTDMYAPKPAVSKCQRMWMTTDYHAQHPYFKTHERVIAIS